MNISAAQENTYIGQSCSTDFGDCCDFQHAERIIVMLVTRFTKHTSWSNFGSLHNMTLINISSCMTPTILKAKLSTARVGDKGEIGEWLYHHIASNRQKRGKDVLTDLSN